jgi:formylglycine-generating enzyme required for sulfatase activity
MSYATKEMVASTGLPMVRVTGGVFEMGCKSGRDGSCKSNELPLHWVKVNDFSIGKYPVTQKQWIEVMGKLPTNFTSNDTSYMGDNKPVIYVSYTDIVTPTTGFLDKLNALTGLNYRLPTEAEWEYAARGCDGGECESLEFSGSKTVGDVAWYIINLLTSSPQPVGGKAANKLGIHDMSGNVWEWCYDWYDTYSSSSASSPLDNPTGPTTPGSYRVIRGGYWAHEAYTCRVAFRVNAEFNEYGNHLGLRLVLP